MARKRKFTYPPPKTASSGGATGPTAADLRAAAAASRVATINLSAMGGRKEVVQGGRVQITSGLYAGEFAIVESVVGGVIPAAVVRTEAGRTRRVRTIDLNPAAKSEGAAKPDAALQPGAAGPAEGGAQPGAVAQAEPTPSDGSPPSGGGAEPAAS
jgi:hypothetical protein